MDRRRWTGMGGAALTLALLAGLAPRGEAQQAPDIPFAPRTDPSLRDPDNPAKTFRVDFARVEQEFPLSRADLMKITPENIAALTQEDVDQLYGRLTAGPIPDGPHLGDLFFARADNGEGGDRLRTRLEEILGGIHGRVAGRSVEFIEDLGRRLWKGKVFYRDERILRNMIENVVVLRPLVDDVDSVRTAAIPRESRIGRALGTDTVWLLFPAKLYCGQSLVDGRRESVIVDYAYTDAIEGYRPRPDVLAGRGGLQIRDEIRMIRPGFYLGRAYMNRMFLLNFTLYNEEVAEREAAGFAAGAAVAEDCWPGEQARRTAVR
jgi:hypothetical protein